MKKAKTVKLMTEKVMKVKLVAVKAKMELKEVKKAAMIVVTSLTGKAYSTRQL